MRPILMWTAFQIFIPRHNNNNNNNNNNNVFQILSVSACDIELAWAGADYWPGN